MTCSTVQKNKNVIEAYQIILKLDIYKNIIVGIMQKEFEYQLINF